MGGRCVTGVAGLVSPGGAAEVVGARRTSPLGVTRMLGRSGWMGGGEGDEWTEMGLETERPTTSGETTDIASSEGSGVEAKVGPSRK